MLSLLEHCTLCPRACGVNRLAGEKGFCGASGEKAEVAKIMLHHWEEPCISGTDPARGSGAIFFVHCTLRCVYCQNSAISGRAEQLRARQIRLMDSRELADAFLKLEADGVYNINLVTPTHYMPQIAEAIRDARLRGLSVPILYNTSGYETREAIQKLDGLVDIFLCDIKYYTNQPAKAYSAAPDYTEYAQAALAQMVKNVGPCRFGADGMLQKGVVVRHLVLPGRAYAAKKIIGKLYRQYGNQLVYSIMNQYTPLLQNPGLDRFPELCAPLAPAEYEEVAAFAAELGLAHAYLQEGEAISESFIPEW